MMAVDYDIASAFQSIEMYLIQSMSRNMKKHLKDEQLENINWTQWQAEMLKGFEEFRASNASILPEKFKDINNQIDALIREAEKSGAMQEEIKILKAIKRGYKAPKSNLEGLSGEFFKINDRKMNALISSTVNDMKKAENAVLRMTNDVYRKTIFSAQVFVNSGAGTIWQAVDMATKSFLEAGINSVQYKNGARVNIASYAEMAIRTANTRAYMMGEAKKREEWGVHTVLVTKHNSACPLCSIWQGRVYIDDVYGAGTSAEARASNYPLLSEAVAGGLFHPNCQNGTSTFFEGVNTPPSPATKEDIEEQTRRYNLKQEQHYNERQIRKYKRLEAGTLDENAKKKYTDKKEQWINQNKKLISENSDVLRRNFEREKLRITDDIKKSSVPVNIKVEPTVAVVNEPSITMDYISKVYPKKHASAMKDIMDNASLETRQVWAKYENDIRSYNPDYKGSDAHYHPAYKGIRVNISQDAKGTHYKPPYSTTFHEFAHNIDYLANEKYGTGYHGKAISEFYKSKNGKGLFGKTITSDAMEHIINRFPQNQINAIKAGYTANNSLSLNDYIITKVKTSPDYNKICDSFFSELKNNLSLNERMDISDMFEGATGIKYPLGFGHGVDYWRTRDNGKEAFAEMYSALVNNPQSLKQIKQYFPNAYNVFEEILKEIVK